MKFAINTNNVENVILLDGITRTGKFLLSKIVSEFEGVEFFQSIPVLEQIPYIFELGGVTRDAAVSLIKSSIDYASYNQFLGRGLNHRILDRSSIYNTSDSALYLKRQFENLDNKDILRLMRSDSKYFLFVTHNVLANINIFLDAYQDLKVVYIVRNPVDLVYSWNKKGYGKVNSKDFLTMSPDIERKEGSVPWYYNNWDNEYMGLGEIDLVIKSIKTLLMLTAKKFMSLSSIERSKVHILRYEDLLINPLSELKKIEDFFGKPINCKIKSMLLKEGLPNKSMLDKQEEKSNFIYKLTSEKYTRILRNMENNYLSGDDFCGFN
jgi:hypothetical protein